MPHFWCYTEIRFALLFYLSRPDLKQTTNKEKTTGHLIDRESTLSSKHSPDDLFFPFSLGAGCACDCTVSSGSGCQCITC